jgi:hypothetical protein
VTGATYFRQLADDSLFAARQSTARDVKEACMKDAAHFLALAKKIERRAKSKAPQRGKPPDAKRRPA